MKYLKFWVIGVILIIGGVIVMQGQKETKVKLETTMGDIVIALDKSMPVTSGNFETLVKKGFYDGVIFHRVIPNFMIQGGDPLTKDDSKMNLWGTGGPGYTLPAEIKIKNTIGTVATARLGDQVNPEKQSSGSQFYINTADNVSLDDNYTVFGKVVSGMDVVTKIENTPTEAGDRPINAVVLESISLK
jgi:cyclophilin family peptidyl-prolyl cis-trans isomerase